MPHTNYIAKLETALTLARIHGPAWKVTVLEEMLAEEASR